jgi:reversibly glycosylated polypeptide/UDP-arabinopyranose mutase
MSQKIAVVVPTIRPESWEIFVESWHLLFRKHKVLLFKIEDNHDWPYIEVTDYSKPTIPQIYNKSPKVDWLFNKSDTCRNAGFIIAASSVDPDVFISLDDDVLPNGNDPIQEHLDALNMTVPKYWVSTCQDIYPRGVPYGVRDEMEVVLSHGVWANVPDLDAPTQLLNPKMKDVAFNKMNVPKGVLFPFCAMNFAFKPQLLPFIYQAPMSKRLEEYGVTVGDRFGDIWSGVVAKLACDDNNWGVVTGYSTINHSRASNVFTNLRKEALFLEQNETFFDEWTDISEPSDYVKLYKKMLKSWQSDLVKLKSK